MPTYNNSHTRLCTVARITTYKALWTGTSYDVVNPLCDMLHTPNIPPQAFEPYFTFRQFSDNDNGEKIAQSSSYLVGDGSYERKYDTGTAAFAWETADRSSRITNTHLVPANPPTITKKWSDPYRCELCALLSCLITLYDIEQRFSCQFQPVTIAVDNDSALDKGATYTDPVQATDQHFDML